MEFVFGANLIHHNIMIELTCFAASIHVCHYCASNLGQEDYIRILKTVHIRVGIIYIYKILLHDFSKLRTCNTELNTI